jgi:hypothetical protein
MSTLEIIWWICLFATITFFIAAILANMGDNSCIRMFYFNSWSKGYTDDLAKFCNEKAIRDLLG